MAQFPSRSIESLLSHFYLKPIRLAACFLGVDLSRRKLRNCVLVETLIELRTVKLEVSALRVNAKFDYYTSELSVEVHLLS